MKSRKGIKKNHLKKTLKIRKKTTLKKIRAIYKSVWAIVLLIVLLKMSAPCDLYDYVICILNGNREV